MTSPWEHEPRERLTDQQRARLFMEKKGRCHRCSRKIMPGEPWSDEHVIALENGGTNAWTNRDISCCWCKKPKDKEDHGKAAKSRAIATAHVIPNSQRRDKSKMRQPPGMKFDWKAGRYRRDSQ